ncbi:hypothetical protein R1flu_023081 [Riccia fluitans]|uniref:N-acetyltransferase domain-containing protein n=1 Tax=Riccia fluitans TaxID=41844 RepID=A0ABD1XR14_9MARC
MKLRSVLDHDDLGIKSGDPSEEVSPSDEGRLELRASSDRLNSTLTFDPLILHNDKETRRYDERIFVVLVVDNFTGLEKIIGNGLSVPVYWAHPWDDSTLPQGGWDSALASGVELELSENPQKSSANTLCALEVIVHPDYRYKRIGRDLATEMILKMKEHARLAGCVAMVVPVRPTLKHLPEFVWMDMSEYCCLIKEEDKEKSRSKSGRDGELLSIKAHAEAFDPWIRKHLKLGGRIVSVCNESFRVEGTKLQWEEWTGVNFSVPSSRPNSALVHGDGRNHLDSYEVIVPGALVPVKFYPGSNLGIYVEPNVWIRHF